MKNFFVENKGKVSLAIVVVGIAFISGFYFGKSDIPDASKLPQIIGKDANGATNVDFAPFWKAWVTLNDKYVPTNGTSTDKVPDQTRVWGAIQGMTASLGDPYTVFFPPAQAQDFKDQISGNFEGVGMEVGVQGGIITVIAPLKGTPAFRAGIKSGDKILKINDESTEKMTVEDAIRKIKGKKGTDVTFSIFRQGVKDPLSITVTRDIIDIPTIDTETKGDVFIIHMYSFSATSPELFRTALREFIQSGKSRLIIDLRGNPGGYLEAAQDMASWFLPAGKVIVKEDFRNASDAQIYRSKGYDIFNDKLRLVVLIDGGSASASEILSGALHDNGVATLVGVKSFGKGSVQELVPITDDTSLKVTIARWLTPNGISISHNGIMPDVEVKLDPDQYKAGVDTQVQKAIEILDK